MQYLVAYDISTETAAGRRRLGKVARICEGYGVRVQKSVFECRIPGAARVRLEAELADAIDRRTDTVIIYDFPGELALQRTTLGRGAGSASGPWIP